MTHPQQDKRRTRMELVALVAILALFALWFGHLISAPVVTP